MNGVARFGLLRLTHCRRSLVQASDPLRRNRGADGFLMPLAMVAIVVLGLGVAVLASRSGFGLLGAVRQSDSRKAKEAAEFGFNAILEALNTNENSYLLVTKYANWQTVTNGRLTACNVKLPVLAASSDRIAGVASNSGNPAVTLPSDSTATYSLTAYTVPVPAVLPASGCSSAASAFGSLSGGRAVIEVLGTVRRNGQVQATYTLKRDVHVRGLVPAQVGGSAGDFALYLTGRPDDSDMKNASFYYDANANGVLNTSSDQPLAVSCFFCSQSATQSALRSTLGMSNGVIGEVVPGAIQLPSFPSLPSVLSSVSPSIEIKNQNYTDFPYTEPGDALHPSCRERTVAGVVDVVCRVYRIELTSGNNNILVTTVNPAGQRRPVTIFLGDDIKVTGNRAFENVDPVNSWADLRLLGVCRVDQNGDGQDDNGGDDVALGGGSGDDAERDNLAEDDGCDSGSGGSDDDDQGSCESQYLEVTGAARIRGLFAWLPKGSVHNTGGGGGGAGPGDSGNFYGVLWACQFDGSGSDVFMAPRNASDALTGIVGSLNGSSSSASPLQPLVYRAYGVR